MLTGSGRRLKKRKTTTTPKKAEQNFFFLFSLRFLNFSILCELRFLPVVFIIFLGWKCSGMYFKKKWRREEGSNHFL